MHGENVESSFLWKKIHWKKYKKEEKWNFVLLKISFSMERRSFDKQKTNGQSFKFKLLSILLVPSNLFTLKWLSVDFAVRLMQSKCEVLIKKCSLVENWNFNKKKNLKFFIWKEKWLRCSFYLERRWNVRGFWFAFAFASFKKNLILIWEGITLKSGSAVCFLNEPMMSNRPGSIVIIRAYVDVLKRNEKYFSCQKSTELEKMSKAWRIVKNPKNCRKSWELSKDPTVLSKTYCLVPVTSSMMHRFFHHRHNFIIQ